MAAALTGAMSGQGCVYERGEAWSRGPSMGERAITIVAVGGARDDRSTRAVAQRLRDEAFQGAQLLIWLGQPAGKRVSCKELDAEAGPLRELRASLEGTPIYAVGSPAGHRCPGAQWPEAVQPAANYVLEVDGAGRVRLVSSCDEAACKVEGIGGDARLRLVFVDVSAWIFPELEDEDAVRDLAQLESLLAALRSEPNAYRETPHILVSALPMESAGSHGLGGWNADATFRHHPESLQAAMAQGVFDGVIAGYEHNLQYVGDLGWAVKRSARVWLDRPAFQIVAGSAGDPDALHYAAPRTTARWQNQALWPETVSPRAGFATFRTDGNEAEVALHAKHGRGWKAAHHRVQLGRPAHPEETAAPSQMPCMTCDPVQGSSDGEKWEKRRERMPGATP